MSSWVEAVYIIILIGAITLALFGAVPVLKEFWKEESMDHKEFKLRYVTYFRRHGKGKEIRTEDCKGNEVDAFGEHSSDWAEVEAFLERVISQHTSSCKTYIRDYFVGPDYIRRTRDKRLLRDDVWLSVPVITIDCKKLPSKVGREVERFFIGLRKRAKERKKLAEAKAVIDTFAAVKSKSA